MGTTFTDVFRCHGIAYSNFQDNFAKQFIIFEGKFQRDIEKNWSKISLNSFSRRRNWAGFSTGGLLMTHLISPPWKRKEKFCWGFKFRDELFQLAFSKWEETENWQVFEKLSIISDSFGTISKKMSSFVDFVLYSSCLFLFYDCFPRIFSKIFRKVLDRFQRRLYHFTRHSKGYPLHKFHVTNFNSKFCYIGLVWYYTVAVVKRASRSRLDLELANSFCLARFWVLILRKSFGFCYRKFLKQSVEFG